MIEPDHYRKLERLYAEAPINAYFAPELQVSAGSAEITIPVREDFFHAAHAVHGALYFKALDDAAFFAANSLVKDVFVLTVSFNTHLLRPVSDGVLHAVGRVVSRSRRMIVAESELRDSQGHQLGRGSGIFMPSTIRLTPDVGYA